MATIDSLDIQISGSAQKANDAVKSLIDNLSKLANSLNIDTSKLSNIGKALNFSGIEKTAKTMQSQSQKVTKTLAQMKEQYKELGKDFEPSDSLRKLQNQLSKYSDLLQKAKLDKESFEASGDVKTKSYDTAVKNFYKYGNVIENIKKKIEEFNSTPIKMDFDFSQMSEAELDKALGFPNVSTWADKISRSAENVVEESRDSAREFTGIWSGIELPDLSSSIKDIGESLNQLVIPPIKEDNLDKLYISLEKTEAKLDELRANLENGITMGRITESVDDKGYVKLQEQIALTEKTATALRDRINEVGKSAKNTSGLKEVGKSANTASDSFSKLSKNSLKASNSLKKMQSSLKGVLRALLPILGIRELVRFGKESIKSSMDYLEILNYFDAAFGQVASNADLSAFEKMGYNSAESYYNSFVQRAEQLTAKMSGFTIGEGGLLQSTGAVSLGLDPSQLMNYQAMFGQMASSMGATSETALKLSQALTEIGADLASVKNMDFEDVWNDMASGLAGMSRTLDKYGVNIRNVNLQHKLNELGINANISALNQNDKALLTAIILLENTKYAWGDLADTINQPANQLRMIQANFQNLSRTIGNLFLPIVKTVLPYINALVIAIQRLFAWLGNLIGIDISDISTSIGSTDISGFLDQTDDLSDSLGGVADNAKKAKAGLRAFDELKTISMPEESKGGAGVGGIGGGLLDAAFEDAFSKYQQEWDKAFAGLENRAQELADKIEKIFEPIKKIVQDFAIGDFFQAGKDTSALVSGIFNFFARAIDKVDWFGIGRKIGDFLEGIDWIKILKSVGELIWQALKAALELFAGAFVSAPFELALIGLATVPNILKKITSSKYITGFKKLGKVAKDSLWAITAGFKGKDIGTGLSIAIENIRENLSGVQKAVIGVFGVWAEFSLVKSGFYDLTSGADNLVVSLGKIAAGAGVAVGALKLIGLSNPWTALIVGATGLVGAIMGIDKAQKEALAKLVESQELEVFGEKFENIAQKISEVSQKTREWIDTSEEYVNNAGLAESQLAKDLADRYFNLAEKENLTNEEKKAMERIAKELVETIPSLREYYDEETGLIDTTRESVEQLIESRMKEIKINAAEEKLTEAYSQRIEQLSALEIATEAMENALEKINELEEKYNKLAEKKEAFLRYQELSSQIMNGVDATGELEEEQRKLYDFLTEGGKVDFPALTSLNEELLDAETELLVFQDTYDKAFSEYLSAENAYQEIEGEINKLGDMLYESASDMGEGTAESWEEGILSRSEFVKEAALSVGNNAINSLEKTENSARQAGVNAAKGFALGMSSQIKNVKSAAGDIANSAKETMQKLLDIHSPSKVMFELGGYTMQGFQNGMENLYQPILNSAKAFSYDIEVAHAPDINNFYGSYGHSTDTYSPQNNFGSCEMSDTIEKAIYTATYNAVSSAIGNSKTLGDIKNLIKEGRVIEMDGREVSEVVRQYANNYTRAQGEPYFSF